VYSCIACSNLVENVFFMKIKIFLFTLIKYKCDIKILLIKKKIHITKTVSIFFVNVPCKGKFCCIFYIISRENVFLLIFKCLEKKV
jgi:hypothetical protein